MWKNSVSVTLLFQYIKIITHRRSVTGVFTLCYLCVSASVNKRVADLSEELARKVEDSLRQQEEISSLLAQIVDLQARCKGVRETLLSLLKVI